MYIGERAKQAMQVQVSESLFSGMVNESILGPLESETAMNYETRVMMRYGFLYRAVLGSSSTTDVLNLMVGKLFRNLERRVGSEAVIERTLKIFNQSVTGVSVVHAPERVPYFVVSGRLILQSPLVKEFIMDHQNPRFAFLSVRR